MSLNNDAFATKFTGELDKILVSSTAVGFMTDNALRAKFVGAKTVKIPSISMQGLGDYDRNTGFISGAINVANTAYTMKQDRARTFSIDREDMDETGIAELAGSVMGEFVRTKVVPETDSYTLSKLAGLAVSRSQVVDNFDAEKPYALFNTMLAQVQTETGFDEEIVCFVNPYMWNCLKKSDEFTKQISVSNFKQGEVNLEVSKIDNVTIIPVAAARMQSAYEFLDGTEEEGAGGFTARDGAKGVYMLMLPKKAASLVRKSEKIRIFSPDQNITADAYKFDYRLYYDVFVKTSYLPTIWTCIAPSVTISSNVTKNVSKTSGSITGSASVTATASDSSSLAYQWYECDDTAKNGSVRILNQTNNTMSFDTTLEKGVYHYFCRVTAGNATALDSDICTLTIA